MWMVYVLSVYNKKEKYHRITMAAFNIQEALIWKEKVESVIDQYQESLVANGIKYVSFEYKSGIDNGRKSSSSDRDSQFSVPEDEEDDSHANFLWRTTTGNGPPESIFDWTAELDSYLSNQNTNNQAFSGKHWRPKSCSRAMRAVGVVEASCEEIIELVMSMDTTRFEWDCSFQYGSLVEEVDGHTAILYHRLQQDWFPMCVWPRDLCYVRYWCRNEDGSYGSIRIELVNIFLKQMKGVLIRESQLWLIWLQPLSSKKSQKLHNRSTSLEQINAANKNGMMMDEYSDEDDEFQIPDPEACSMCLESDVKKTVTYNVMTGIMVVTVGEYLMGTTLEFVAIIFIMINQRSGKHLMELVAVDWFKDTKRMGHVARRRGCAAQVASEKGFFSIVVNLQVPGSTHYNMIFYFVMKELVPGSLLQRFVDGDDEFRYSRLKIIPSVPNGSWIVRQSVGSTPCLLAKAVDCNYIRGPKYLEIDVDIGSSTVANGVLGLVIGMITTLVVVLLQANTANELPEQLIGAVRVSHRVVVCYCP
ncbi:unnamed protein product [Camellia sinensis]